MTDRYQNDRSTFSRDGYPSNWQNIMLCAGASEGIRACLKLMTNPGA